MRSKPKMGQIIQTIDWWWDFFRNLFGIKDYYVRGHIVLANGQHEIFIQTKDPNPERVYLNCEEPDGGMSVCMGDVNLVGSSVTPDGFVLYADIKSDTCIVRWLIEYDAEHDVNANSSRDGMV